jgi:hypothetical protein
MGNDEQPTLTILGQTVRTPSKKLEWFPNPSTPDKAGFGQLYEVVFETDPTTQQSRSPTHPTRGASNPNP